MKHIRSIPLLIGTVAAGAWLFIFPVRAFGPFFHAFAAGEEIRISQSRGVLTISSGLRSYGIEPIGAVIILALVAFALIGALRLARAMRPKAQNAKHQNRSATVFQNAKSA